LTIIFLSETVVMQYRHRFTRGFTLIELLVVLLILGMIAGIAGPQIMNYLGDSKAKAAKLQIGEFEGTLDLYKLDVGRYPDSQEGLQALVQAPAAGNHGAFDIVSFGADGKEGGDGENKDIVSWE
jgi:general secretion pathway protein G